MSDRMTFFRRAPTLRRAVCRAASKRQSQDPFSRVNPRIFSSRAALSTLAFRRAPSFAAGSPWKEKFMSAVIAFGVALSLPMATFAQTIVSQRLMAASFSLTESNIQARIWSDQVPDLLKFQRDLQAKVDPSIPLAAEVFSTTFVINGRRIIISVLNSNCGNTPVENLRTCPARLAELEENQIRILKDWPMFAIASLRGERGYDASSNAQTQFMTIATYDPATRQISFADVVDGEKSAGATAVTIP
jgi:hypothetical protein